MLHYEIESGIELRLPEEKHARELFELVERNRDYLGKWMFWVEATKTAEDTRNFLRHARRGCFDRTSLTLCIFKDGRIVGVVGMSGLKSIHNIAEVGYWIDESHQGKGIVTRATRAFVDYAFRDFDVNRMEIRCAVENRRSRAIPIKLGFVEDGVLRQAMCIGETYLDAVVYSMLRQEWRGEQCQNASGEDADSVAHPAGE